MYYFLRADVPFDITKGATSRLLRTGICPVIEWRGIDDLTRNLVMQCLELNMRDRPSVMELLMHPVFHGLPSESSVSPGPSRRQSHHAAHAKAATISDVLPLIEADESMNEKSPRKRLPRPRRKQRRARSVGQVYKELREERRDGADLFRQLAHRRCERTMQRNRSKGPVAAAPRHAVVEEAAVPEAPFKPPSRQGSHTSTEGFGEPAPLPPPCSAIKEIEPDSESVWLIAGMRPSKRCITMPAELPALFQGAIDGDDEGAESPKKPVDKKKVEATTEEAAPDPAAKEEKTISAGDAYAARRARRSSRNGPLSQDKFFSVCGASHFADIADALSSNTKTPAPPEAPAAA
jgi:hypothetical protein